MPGYNTNLIPYTVTNQEVCVCVQHVCVYEVNVYTCMCICACA